VNLIRYADDFIITGATKEVLENEVKPLVEQFLRDRGLQLSPEKTCVTPSNKGSTSSDKISASMAANCSSNLPGKTRTRSWKRCGNSSARIADSVRPT
jgi:hypothetical protein